MKEYKYKINGKAYSLQVESLDNNIAQVKVNGEEFTVEIIKEEEPKKEKVIVKPPMPQKPIKKDEEGKKKITADNAVMAPLPGVIQEIKVSVGDTVKIGDTVVVLEAMKMANNLDTEVAGTVTEILVQEGESVMENTPLVVIE